MADPLDFAWFEYAPAALKNQYREAGKNPGKTETLHRLMAGEVQLKIADSELVALGVQTAPIPQDHAREISPTFFQAESTHIDWSQATVTGLGQAFAEVRVCIPQTRPPEPIAELALADSGEKPKKRGGGRNSQYPQAREILKALFKEPSYAVLPANGLLDAFNRAYLDRFQQPGGKLAPISERSLRDHLKRYRQELAETGRN